MAGRLRTLLYTTCVTCLAASGAYAQLANESLIAGVPKGYKIGFQNKTERRLITEFVPQKETVEDWTAMVTHQVFYGGSHIAPDKFEETMIAAWKKACPNAETAHVKDGIENGYAFSFWLQRCDLNPKTGKAEVAWLKAIQGRDSFYVVQTALRSSPSKQQAIDASLYLRAVQVCDTRGSEHPCPALKKLPPASSPART
jgi:hypothetical protein